MIIFKNCYINILGVVVLFNSGFATSIFLEQSNELIATKILDEMPNYGLSIRSTNSDLTIALTLDQTFSELYRNQVIPGGLTKIMAEYANQPVLYCTMPSNKIAAVNVQTGGKVDIRVGKDPNFAILVGENLYVLNYTKNASSSGGVSVPGDVSVIDITTQTKVGEDIIVGTNPEYAMLMGTDLYVLNLDTVSIIDTVTNKKRGIDILHLAFDDAFREKGLSVPRLREDSKICRLRSFNSLPIGNNWYTMNLCADTISVTPQGADVLTKLCDDIKVGNGARFTMPNGKYMCVISQGTDTISIIDISNNSKIGKDISVGRYPLSVIWIDENLVVFCVDGAYLINLDSLEKRH